MNFNDDVYDKSDKSEKDLISTSENRTDSSGSTASMDTANDENKDRGNWTGKLDFILSCIGYAVGLGNIWRFPYLCYKNGGGAFLIPYIIFMILCGMPLVFLEMSYGQFSSLSPISAWNMCPLFKGIGWGMIIISGMVCIYYNIIITWTLYYLFMSFTSVLPWSTCDNDWNDYTCALRKHLNNNGTNMTLCDKDMVSYATIGSNGTNITLCDNGTVTYATSDAMKNISMLVNQTIKYQTPSEQYWENHVLDISDGIEDIGTIRWQLLLCLVLAWVVVFLCLIKGIKSSGRVVYVTATFPYLVLVILLVRGVTLPGAMEGIKFYLIPDWSKLLEFKVWGDAACQIFYSVGAAWGAMITMASYNRFQHNVWRDATIVPLINCCTSIFAGLVIFSIVGFMAHETGQEIDQVVTQGPGLIFVVYPEALANLPISPLWSILFFLMVFTVGLDSQFGMFETLTSAFIDEFPNLFKKRKILFTAILCFVEFLIGLPMITNGGIYVLQIMDWYSSVFSLMILSFLECIVIGWVYGINRYYEDLELMLGKKPFIWYKISWCVVTPATILFILIFSFVTHKPVTYDTYTYPDFAIFIGWMFALVSLLPLPGVALYQIIKGEGTLVERVRHLLRPDPSWGPAVQEHRDLYLNTLSPKERRRMNKLVGSSTASSDVSIPEKIRLETDRV